MTNSCLVCGQKVRDPQHIDFPEGVVLCSKHFQFSVWKCQLCGLAVADSSIDGGDNGIESTVNPLEMWCRNCCNEYAAVCECCGVICSADSLHSEPQRLVCSACWHRNRRIEDGSVQLQEASDWKNVVRTAIFTLPASLQRLIELNEIWGEDKLVMEILSEGPNGDSDEELSKITVRRVSKGADEIFVGDCGPGKKPKAAGSVWTEFDVSGTSTDMSMIHGGRAYDVDLEHAVLVMVLGELANAGIVARDKFGRYVDEYGRKILPFQV